MDLFSLYDRLFEETMLKEDSVLERAEEETRSLDELQYLGQKGSLVYYIDFDDSSNIKVYDDEGNLIRDYSFDELGISKSPKDKLLYIIEDLNLDSVSYSLLQDLLQAEEEEDTSIPSEEEENELKPEEEPSTEQQSEEPKEEENTEEKEEETKEEELEEK